MLPLTFLKMLSLALNTLVPSSLALSAAALESSFVFLLVPYGCFDVLNSKHLPSNFGEEPEFTKC